MSLVNAQSESESAKCNDAVHLTLNYAYSHQDTETHRNGPAQFDRLYNSWYKSLQLHAHGSVFIKNVQDAIDAWWIGGTGREIVDTIIRAHKAAIVNILEGRQHITPELRNALHESSRSLCTFTSPDGLRRLDDILMYPRKVMEAPHYDVLTSVIKTQWHACAERIWSCIVALRTLRPMSDDVPSEILANIADHYLRLPCLPYN